MDEKNFKVSNNISKKKPKDYISEAIMIGAIIIAVALLMNTSIFKIEGSYIVGQSPNTSLNTIICDPSNSSNCVNVTEGQINSLITNNASRLIPIADFDTLCSFDVIPGASCLVFTGHNPDVDDSGSQEDVWEGGGLLEYQTVAELQNISSTDPDDTVGGTGARTLFVQCLNENFTLVSELVSLNGTTTVQTVNECIRNRFIAVFTSGSSGFNEGTITATSADSGLLQVQMDETEAFDKNSQFTVEAGHTAIIKKVMFSTTKSGGQSPIVEFKGKIRFFGSNTWTETYDFKIDTSVSDNLIMDNPISNQLSEKTDFRIEVTSTTDNVDVNARIWLVEVPTDSLTNTARILG